MSTIVKAAPPSSGVPIEPPADVTPGKRRQRWPFILLLLVSVVALIVPVGGLTVWFASTHYKPLRANHGGGFSTVRVQSGHIVRVGALEPSTYRPLVAFDARYRDGEWLEHGFTLVNDSPFTITVEQIGSGSGSGQPLRPVSVSINAPTVEPWGPGIPAQMVAFRPFTIPPHDARFVLVRLRFVGCTLKTKGTTVRFAAEAVKFRIQLGWWSVHRSANLPLPYSVEVSGNQGCPA